MVEDLETLLFVNNNFGGSRTVKNTIDLDPQIRVLSFLLHFHFFTFVFYQVMVRPESI